MTSARVQRWRSRRESYRPAGEVIDPRRYEIAAIPDDTSAKAFVREHHYSGTYPAARWRFGLFERGGRLAGVAVFSHPCHDRVLTNVFPVAARDAVELGRFVLLDSVAGNGETWFLARCFEQLRHDVAGVVSFSDPVARATADGRTVHPGHVGTIYQAYNGVYLGRGRAQVLHVLPDGTVFSHRAKQKLRAAERGWRAAAARLQAFGALPPQPGADLGAWVDHWLARLARQLRHPGNHKYAWALDRSLRSSLPPRRPYPKRHVEPLQLALAA